MNKRSGALCAIKEVDPCKLRNPRQITSELSCLIAVGSHPFITRLQCAFVHEKQICCFVFEGLLGGDLGLHLSCGMLFSESCVAYYVACIGSALNHLHRKNILHRDVKPENIVLDLNGVPKLIDFGVSYQGEECCVPVCKSSSGTLAYMAPEVLMVHHQHSYQADFWSLGVVAYELLYGERPFERYASKHLVHFCENQYLLLWPQAEKAKNTSPYLFDWEAADSSICETHRQAGRHYLGIALLSAEDKAKDSPYLCCSMPDVLADRSQVSRECVQALSSLLDVRVPVRLGSPHDFCRFSDHPWLAKYGYDNSGHLLTTSPQFLPNAEVVRAEINLVQSFTQPKPDIIRTEVTPLQREELLNRFTYLAQSNRYLTTETYYNVSSTLVDRRA